MVVVDPVVLVAVSGVAGVVGVGVGLGVRGMATERLGAGDWLVPAGVGPVVGVVVAGRPLVPVRRAGGLDPAWGVAASACGRGDWVEVVATGWARWLDRVDFG
jgi:hypothetical protein